ncbi:HAD-IA family hydrolase [Planctomycetales bacterium ZRK34]|nr:HAD-IA family hydrolase [Planctomycetales bacterium ZRK34]
MSKPEIQVVCFDLGGVLLRCVDGWHHACERAGLPMHESLIDPANRNTIVSASNQMEIGAITPQQFTEQIAAVSDYTAAEAMRVLECWLLDLYPGVEALLERLLGAPITVALLSNTNAAHWQIFEAEPCYAPVMRIPHLFASHQVKARKPNAAIYEHVETALGVEPQSILFFDDLEENINGAVWQHWHTERIDPAKDTAPQIEKHLARYGVTI